ncbi:MAG: DUF4924 family protein [Clostridiales bacterium]|nr:DUF4924 family protein [Clostridiales bacterium]
MIIASQKRKENIAEYLLYMWQIEDLIRAYNLDIEKIKSGIIDRYDITGQQRQQMIEWYESLIDMMHREGIEKSGHLQLTKNVLIQLAGLHQELLKDPKFADYTALFYKTLPYIVELRAKAGDNKQGELETCFTALYGTLLLKLQGKQISPDTQEAIKNISKFLGTLAHYFKLDDEDQLFEHDNH